MERLQILLKLYPKYVNELNKRTYLNAQLKWELLKYKIRRLQLPIVSNALKEMNEKESTVKIS